MEAVSLDFWNTIATPNKTYAKLRTEYLHDNYGLTKDDYMLAKQHLDLCAEWHGMATTPRGAVAHLFYPMSNWHNRVDVDKIVEDLEQLFLENPPTVLPDVEKAVRFMLDNEHNWGIISNTNFISGAVLKEWVKSYFGITTPIPMRFSDLCGVSKPNMNIFITFFTEMHMNTRGKIANPSHIHHIGDHNVCDLYGALKAGYKAHLYYEGVSMYGLVRQIFD